MKLLKILLGIVLSIVLIIIVSALALMLLVNPNDYKPQLEQLAAKQHIILHIEGDLGWSFYPHLGVRSGKFSIKPPMKNITKPLEFDEINVSVKLLPLLHRQIVANKVTVRGKELTWHDDTSNNDSTVTNLVIEADKLNLEQKPFPLLISMQVKTTHPPRELTFKLNTQLSIDKDITKISLANINMSVDDTRFTGNIDATLGNKPFLNVSLSGSDFNADHYFPVDENKKNTPVSSTGKKEADFIPAENIQALPGNYHFSFDNLTLQHLVGNQFSTDIQVTHDGILTIKKLQTKAYGGEYIMHGSIDTRQSLPAVALTMSLKNMALEPAMKDYFQVDKTFASGDFGFDADITTRGLKWGQLMQAMNGEFSFASKTITLNKLDLTSSLDQSLLQLLQVKIPKLLAGQNQTVLSNMTGKGLIRNGLIDNTSLTASSLCTEFTGHGSFDLPTSAIDYHMGITFPSTDTNKTCSEINAKLKDIAWPVVCKGTMADDTGKLCNADSAAIQTIVKKVAAKAMNKKLGDKLDKKIDKKFGKDGEQVKQLLKGLF